MKNTPLACSLLVSLLVMSTLTFGQAQEKVLYTFGAYPGDGEQPNGGLIFDKAGNIYGTTVGGGQEGGAGAIFELSPQNDGTWAETILYSFCLSQGCPDGQNPRAGVIENSSGNLYGTAVGGGAYKGGVAFELSPPSLPGGAWTETVIWNFGGPSDGAGPSSRLSADSEGNFYSTAGGAAQGAGVVFELSPNGLGSWSETVLYSFCQIDYPQCPDGTQPGGGVTFDKRGNLYGVTFAGGNYNAGVFYQLSPPAQANAWTETVLYKFLPSGGGNPYSDVNFDPLGDAYVTVTGGNRMGPAACGAVMKFVPQVGGGGAKFEFPFGLGALACAPYAGVLIDAKGRAVYGTATAGGSHDGGSVYKIVGHMGTGVYNFCQLANCADGEYPNGSLTPDGQGNLYSTTWRGGQYYAGVVFELTP